jgi:hypothetical protein
MPSTYFPRKLFLDLKKRHEEYRSLLHTETSAASYHRLFAEETPTEAARPSIGFIVLTPDTDFAPGKIFHWPEKESYVTHVAPETLTAPGVVDKIEFAFQTNRFRPSPHGLLGRMLERGKQDALKRTREALLTVYHARQTIEQRSPAIRRAIEDGVLAIVETIYDPHAEKAHLDVAGIMKE